MYIYIPPENLFKIFKFFIASIAAKLQQCRTTFNYMYILKYIVLTLNLNYVAAVIIFLIMK